MSTTARRAPDAPPEAPTVLWDRPVYRLTAAQVQQMVDAGVLPDGARAELLDGVLYAMTKKEPHNATVGLLAEALRPLVAAAPERHHVREEKSQTADPYSLPEPDVAVVRGTFRDYGRTPPPLSAAALVAEVNASSPEDHTRKLAKYAAAGVATYWVVDLDRDQVVAYTEPDGAGAYARRDVHRRGQPLPVVVAGHPCGAVDPADFLPEPEDAGA